jgi:hypothetical protein
VISGGQNSATTVLQPWSEAVRIPQLLCYSRDQRRSEFHNYCVTAVIRGCQNSTTTVLQPWSVAVRIQQLLCYSRDQRRSEFHNYCVTAVISGCQNSVTTVLQPWSVVDRIQQLLCYSSDQWKWQKDRKKIKKWGRREESRKWKRKIVLNGKKELEFIKYIYRMK